MFHYQVQSLRHFPCPEPDQSSPRSRYSSCRPILMLFFHLRVDLPSGLFPSGFRTKCLCAPNLSPLRDTCPSHLTVLYFITRIIFGEDTDHEARYYAIPSSPLESYIRVSLGLTTNSTSVVGVIAFVTVLLDTLQYYVYFHLQTQRIVEIQQLI